MDGNGTVGFLNYVKFEHRNAAGELVDDSMTFNTVTNAGLEWLKNLMGAGGGGQALYIGVTATAITPAASDTALSGEYTTNGLARAAGAYAAGATGVYTVTNTFTCSAASQTVSSAGLFWAASGTALFAEVALSSPATLQSGDTLSITWTVTITGS